jgi:isopentenyl-diphosphate delta-isomerase
MKTSKTHIFKRKNDHIKFVLNNEVEGQSSLLECVKIIHNALPEINLENVDLATQFLGKKISSPIIISPITGGTNRGKYINEKLATAAHKANIPLMIGSQRIMLEHPESIQTFKIARSCAPDIPLIANIGIPQLKVNNNLETIEKIMKIIEADALAIHLNPLQEAVQIEGEPNFLNGLEKISDILSSLKKPLIIRETGCGISKEVASRLFEIGVNFIDVSGMGGTSWSAVEYYRSKSDNHEEKTETGKTFWNWGIPTAASIMEVKSLLHNQTDKSIIASGGIRSGLDIAKSLLIGADYAGLAKPFLNSIKETSKNPDFLIAKLEEELRISLFLTGSSNIQDFKQKPKVILPPLKNWVDDRII